MVELVPKVMVVILVDERTNAPGMVRMLRCVNDETVLC